MPSDTTSHFRYAHGNRGRGRLRSIFILASLLLATACIPEPDLKNTQLYSNAGIKFKYPGNWRISEEDTNNHSHYLIVHTNRDGILTMHQFKGGFSPTLNQFADTMTGYYIEEMGEEFVKELKAEPSELSISNKSMPAIAETHTIEDQGQRLPMVRYYSRLDDPAGWIYISFQSPADSFQEEKPGFQLILDTVQNVKQEETNQEPQ
ncbi:MAG: hypothetical protein KDK25_01515 [Leptospiraceae bacterium]|nr:hypothetical protein [Leptospiraceae bacterium]